MATPLPSTHPTDDGALVLVVDDDPYLVDAVCHLLIMEGLQAEGVFSGQAARARLEKGAAGLDRPVDLVLLDRAMPGVSGLEVCRWIKSHPQLGRLPVVMLTAAASVEDKIEGLELGADDYVTKPFVEEELLARTRALLRSHRVEQQLSRRNEQLRTLNRIAAALTSSMETDEILTTTLDGIRQVLRVEAGSLLLLDESGEALVFHKALGDEQEWEIDLPVPLGQGLAGYAAANRTPVLVNDVQNDPRFFPAIDTLTSFTTRSALAVPLTVKDKLLGVMEAINKLDGPFTQEDLELFVSMAASVAVALENATLFNDLRQAYHQVESNRRRLQTTANTLRTLFDGITDGLYIVNTGWLLVAINRGRAEEVGSRPGRLAGLVCYRALYDRQAPCDHCQAAETLEHGWRARWVEQQRRPGGLLDEWELSSYPIFDRQRQPTQAIILRREVTEQRRLEASLAQAEKLAAIGQLAAGLAHEINNPLAAIIANAQLLQQDLAPDSESHQSAELVARAGERAARVVRRLLDFARPEALERQPVEVNTSLRESLTLLEAQLEAAAVEVVARLAPDLPPISASADHLQSIWLNLLVNARDALAGREAERRIELQTRLAGGMVEVRVADNGCGIPAEALPNIFDPFYTTKSPGEGTGLGLATTYRLVEQHGGRIEVASQVGQGTTFVVRLPVETQPGGSDL